MSHGGSGRDSCNTTTDLRLFQFGSPTIARGVTDPDVGSGALLAACLVLGFILLSDLSILDQTALTKLAATEWRLAVGFREIAPTDYLGRDIGASDLLRVDPSTNEHLESESSRMIQEYLHGLRSSNWDWLIAESSNEYFLLVRNLELNRANRANPAILQLPKPLVRNLEISQHRRGIDASEFLAAPNCRSNAGLLQAVDQPFVSQVDEAGHFWLTSKMSHGLLGRDSCSDSVFDLTFHFEVS
jgi:hypothetical protein